jgi:hypothetical protein
MVLDPPKGHHNGHVHDHATGSPQSLVSNQEIFPPMMFFTMPTTIYSIHDRHHASTSSTYVDSHLADTTTSNTSHDL